jgi:hypothetical protein
VSIPVEQRAPGNKTDLVVFYAQWHGQSFDAPCRNDKPGGTHLIFHIGPEIVDCLMRKSNSAETNRDCPEEQSRVKSSGESRLQGPRVARKRWSLDRLASALFLALRWLL